MNSMMKTMIIALMAILIMPSESIAQWKKDKKNEEEVSEQTADEKAIEEAKVGVGQGYILIKAVELDFGRFEINIDGGMDKEGNERRIVRNVRDEERMHRIVEARSLVNLLGFLSKRGYTIESSYSAVMKDQICHYYLLGNIKPVEPVHPDAANENARDFRRSGQNKPKMSPDEAKKRNR